MLLAALLVESGRRLRSVAASWALGGWFARDADRLHALKDRCDYDLLTCDASQPEALICARSVA